MAGVPVQAGMMRGYQGKAMAESIDVAERVRDACLQAALAAHEDAGISGLCMEGRWEMAVQAIQNLDVAVALEGSRTKSQRSGEP